MKVGWGISSKSQERLKREIEAEIAFHREGRRQELIEQGLDPDQARRKAAREFGDVHQIRQECLGFRKQGLIKRRREQRMRNFLEDLFSCGRMLRRQPVFSFLVILTLAFGIGTSITLFSVVSGVLLTPLPYRDAERIVMVRSDWVKRGIERAPLTQGAVADLLEQASTLEDVAAFWSQSTTLTAEGEAEVVRAAQVTANFFQLLGVDIEGPGFQEGERDVAILTHGYWSTRFGGRPMVGQSVQLFRGGKPHVVKGILPPQSEFHLPNYQGAPTSDTQVWTLMPFDPAKADRTTAWLRVFAKAHAGSTLPQVQAELDAISQRQRELYPRNEEIESSLRAYPLLDEVVSGVKTPLWALMGAVLGLFLIICFNLSNLVAARGLSRTREFAVRRALGAGRGRILGQHLTEIFFLCLAGGGAGILAGMLGIRLIRLWDPMNLVRLQNSAIDARGLLFAAVLVMAAALLAGLAPAWRASRLRPMTSLRTTHRRRKLGRSSRWLVSAQVALSLVLLIGAGLLLRSFLLLYEQDAGFQPSKALTFSSPFGAGQDFFDELEASIAGLPGVEAVGSINKLPLSGSQLTGPYQTERDVGNEQAERPEADLRMVTPGYFDAMDIRLIKGRTFEPGDRQSVFVIDDKLAARSWPGEDPLDKRLLLALAPGEEPVWGRVVGVVGHVRHNEVGVDSREAVYYPVYWKGFVASMVVRSGLDPLSLAEPIREAARQINPEKALSSMRTMQSMVDRSLAPNRFALTLAFFFAAAALFQTVLGIHGIFAHAAAARRRELGVRMALGADNRTVTNLMIREGLRLCIPGIALGMAGAFLLTRTADSLLYGVAPSDPVTYATLSALLLATALAATYLPVRRALKLDPIQALRSD